MQPDGMGRTLRADRRDRRDTGVRPCRPIAVGFPVKAEAKYGVAVWMLR